MKDDGVLFQSLARGLENMQNISSIVYSPRQHYIPAERKALCDLLPRGAFRGFHSVGQFTPPTPPDHPFRQLIGAIFLTGYTGIRRLTVEARPEDDEDVHFWHAAFSLDMFTFPDPNDLRAGQHLFLHLTKVDMSVDVHFGHEALGSAQLQVLENFAKLLETAKGLQHLSLKIIELHKGHFATRLILFGFLGLRTIWPRLRSLSLEGMAGDKEDVLEMITQHKETLRSLHLGEFVLSTGTWADIVDEVVFNAPMISTFTLHRVNDEFMTSENMNFGTWEKSTLEGHLMVGEDGDRNFVCTSSAVCRSTVYQRVQVDTNPAKRSVYAERSR